MAPKSLTHAPKNPTRRSKEERERLDKIESQRRQARADASAADSAAEHARRRAFHGIQRDHGDYRGGRGGLGGSMKYVRGGRGGFMWQRGPTPRTQKRSDKVPAVPGTAPPTTRAGAGASSRRLTARGPNDPAGGVLVTAGDDRVKSTVKRDADEDIAMLGIDATGALKKERDHGYASSEDDEEILGKNIEFINLVSDDEADGSGQRQTVGYQPLRLLRKPHRDRQIPFALDAGPGSPPGSRKGAKAKSRVEHGNVVEDGLPTATRKGKSRGKDIELVRERRRWTGAYEDEIDTTVVKREEDEEGDQAATAEDAQAEEADEQVPESAEPDQEGGSDAETKEAIAAKLKKSKRAAQAANRRLIFQTVEEQREYERQKQDLEDVQYELGNISVATNTANASEAESSSGAAQEVAAAPNRREDTVYLFQLPPIIPDLLEPSVKQETSSPEISARSAPVASASNTNPSTSGPIKIEEDQDASNTQNAEDRSPKFAAGKVGKFRIHKSGRATLTWGGTSMEVSQGTNPYFLQSVVLANIDGSKDANGTRSMDVDGDGEATSFGQVRGKLVVTPDWSEILG